VAQPWQLLSNGINKCNRQQALKRQLYEISAGLNRTGIMTSGIMDLIWLTVEGCE